MKRWTRLVEDYTWVVIVAVLASYVVQQIRDFGGDFGQWDFLLLSGWAALAAGLVLSRTVPARLDTTLARLRDCGALDAADDRLAELNDELHHRARTWGAIGAGVVAVVMVAAFLIAKGAVFGTLLVLETLGGALAGYHLGRMASYGSLGSLLERHEVTWRVTPGHFDGAGGLKPVGDYYLFQAMVAAIPAAFLAGWWVIIPLVPRDYSRWRNPYLGLLALAIVVELLAFFVPVSYFHREMERQKRDFLHDADVLSSQMAHPETPGDVDPAKLAAAKARYELIGDTPTWPMDAGTRKRFRVRNLALMAPIAAKIVGTSGPWNALADALSRLGK